MNHTLKAELWVEWFYEIDKFNEGSMVLLPNITHTWNKPFAINHLAFTHKTIIAWDDGFDFARNSSDGIFIRWCAGLQWKLTKKAILTLPGFNGLIKLSNPHDGRRNESSWNVEIKFIF